VKTEELKDFCLSRALTDLPLCHARIAQLEAALVALIDAVDAKDEKAIQNALFVGRGLTF
jgi:hypothetical protein